MEILYYIFLLISILCQLALGNIRDILPLRALKVSQCRATCIDDMVKIIPTTQSICSEEESCYICWDSCFFIENSNELCDYEDLCPEECKRACSFYKQKHSLEQIKKGLKRIPDWRFEVPITMHAYSYELVLRWIPPQMKMQHQHLETEDNNFVSHGHHVMNNIVPKYRNAIVYVLMKKCKHHTQLEVITETIDTMVTLTSDDLCPKGPTDFKLQAISQLGLLASSGAKFNGTIIPKKETWNLYLLQLNSNNNGTYEAVIVWSALMAKGNFRVTWKDSRSTNTIAGQTVTDASIVTIGPLNPNSVYMVEAEATRDGSRSQPLLINTSTNDHDNSNNSANAVQVNPSNNRKEALFFLFIPICAGIVVCSIYCLARRKRLKELQFQIDSNPNATKEDNWHELESLNDTSTQVGDGRRSNNNNNNVETNF